MNEIVHIPCGLRCFTKRLMRETYNIGSETLPFDYGFFNPFSIKKLLNTDYININLENTSPCIKTENYTEDNKIGIKFVESSYEEIDKLIEENGYDNKYLDSTCGYYTLLKDYDCVLAHYNWHKMSNNTITEPKENLKILEETLNRRKQRLDNILKNSETIHIHYDKAGYEIFIINKEKYDISPSVVKEQLINSFSIYGKKIIYYDYDSVKL